MLWFDLAALDRQNKEQQKIHLKLCWKTSQFLWKFMTRLSTKICSICHANTCQVDNSLTFLLRMRWSCCWGVRSEGTRSHHAVCCFMGSTCWKLALDAAALLSRQPLFVLRPLALSVCHSWVTAAQTAAFRKSRERQKTLQDLQLLS